MSTAGFLARAHKLLIYLGGLYAVALLLMMTASVQRQVIYLNKISVPLRAKFDIPQKYGLAPNKAINLNLTTSDQETLGAWFVFSEIFFRHSSKTPGQTAPFGEDSVKRAISEHPTVIFFHGNAANRAAQYRVSLYSSLTTRLGANVLAIDYRGYGDSTGTPTEQGLLKDGQAAWAWLRERGASPESIIIVGHSLGTSVTALLAEQLAAEGIHPRGVALISPFSSIRTVARTYTLFGVIPLLKPLTAFPGAYEALTRYLWDTLDTQSRLPKIKSPILLVHAENDPTIPHSHAVALFDELLEPLLPPLPFSMEELARPANDGIWKQMNEVMDARRQVRNSVVISQTIDSFARISEFSRQEAGKVKHVETRWGGHVDLLKSEGLLDIIGDFFSISRP